MKRNSRVINPPIHEINLGFANATGASYVPGPPTSTPPPPVSPVSPSTSGSGHGATATIPRSSILTGGVVAPPTRVPVSTPPSTSVAGSGSGLPGRSTIVCTTGVAPVSHTPPVCTTPPPPVAPPPPPPVAPPSTSPPIACGISIGGGGATGGGTCVPPIAAKPTINPMWILAGIVVAFGIGYMVLGKKNDK